MLNILIISSLALENGRGGEISSIELASGLKKSYKVILMDTNIFIGKGLLSKEVINKKLEGLNQRGRIKFATLNIFNKTFSFPYPWEVIKLFKLIKKNDIIYSPFSTVKLNLIILFASLIFRRVKFIIGFRKPLYSDKLLSQYNLKNRISILLFSLFKKRFYYHTISEHAKKFLKNFYKPNRIYHIIHGIELENYNKKISISENNDKLRFIYVGHLDNPHKGVGILLDAIEMLLNEHQNLKIFFEFCGSGPLEEKLRILKNKFPKFINYNGYISNELIAHYYKRNDIFLFTSKREPFGRVIIEALASELIIICSKTIGSVEILKGKNFAFFLEELDAKIIKEKIFEIYNTWLKDPDKFRQLKKSAKDYAFQNYSVSQEILSFKNLIEGVSKNNV